MNIYQINIKIYNNYDKKIVQLQDDKYFLNFASFVIRPIKTNQKELIHTINLKTVNIKGANNEYKDFQLEKVIPKQKLSEIYFKGISRDNNCRNKFIAISLLISVLGGFIYFLAHFGLRIGMDDKLFSYKNSIIFSEIGVSLAISGGMTLMYLIIQRQ